jgi:hypothetical protein
VLLGSFGGSGVAEESYFMVASWVILRVIGGIRFGETLSDRRRSGLAGGNFMRFVSYAFIEFATATILGGCA